jgi:hypothetical protein
MRQAGEVIRTDVAMHPDGTPKGNGTVVFINPVDARAAIGELPCSSSRGPKLIEQKCLMALIGLATSWKSER